MAVILLEMIWRCECTRCGRNLGAGPHPRPEGGADLANERGRCPNCGGVATWDLRFLWWEPTIDSKGRVQQRALYD